MLNAPIRILIVAALCVLLLIGLVVREGMARASGQEVMLAMAAVDPRALLQGHYVIVALQEQLPADAPCPVSLEQGFVGEAGAPGARWLSLAANGAHHSVVGAAATRQEAARTGALAVRGDATCFKPASAEGEAPQPGFVQAHVGVDRFYINQAEAQRIEALLREQTPNDAPRIFAIASIGDDGRARLNGLMVDGERLMLDWF